MTDPTEIKNIPELPEYVAVDQTKMETEDTNKDNYVGTIPFSQMNLKKEIMQAITDCGFEHPSEVQSQVIPKALIRQDVLCQAKSGMGKTAVFVISILNQDCCQEDYTSAIVVCHTREMVLQVQKEFKRMKKRLDATKKIRIGAFVGGIDENVDIQNIRKKMPNIVIATPGRLLALVKRQAIKLDKLQTFVIDECDKILSSKLNVEVAQVLERIPKDAQVQKMMFSATISEDNKKICRGMLNNPFEVFIDDGEKLFLHGLHLFYKKLNDNEKKQVLQNIISDIDYNKVMIFVDGLDRCRAVKRLLSSVGETVGMIYGKMDQRKREYEYDRFKKGETRVLISTDLCGRGIDIAEVNVVVNFDMPKESDQFLHRVGRAGRFGTKGIAISFVDTESDENVFADVKKRFVVDMAELPEKLGDIPTNLYK